MAQPAKQQPTAIEKQDPKPKNQMQTLADLIESRKDALAQVAARGFDAGRLVKLAQAAISRTPDLLKCTPLSVLTALMRCAELGLEPNATLAQRRMWLVPRWNGRTKATECIAQIDYRAEIQLARDTGLLSDVAAEEVRQYDRFEIEFSDEGSSLAKFTHRPLPFGDRGPIVGYYAAGKLDGGAVPLVRASAEEMEEFKENYAPRNREGQISGPWVSKKENERVEMAKKTMLHKLFKKLPAGKTEEARRLQEKVAEEDAEVGSVELDVTPPPPPGATRTETLKAKLRGKAEPAESPAPEDDAPTQEELEDAGLAEHAEDHEQP